MRWNGMEKIIRYSLCVCSGVATDCCYYFFWKGDVDHGAMMSLNE